MKTTSKSELASLYNISLPTLNTWLSDIPNLNLKPKVRLLNPNQVKMIYEHLGEPYKNSN